MGLFADGFKELKKASVPLYKTPKSIQETIEIMKVAENGIFEVSRNHFSKCYRFRDINYTTTNEEEQIDIFERYFIIFYLVYLLILWICLYFKRKGFY